jgi:hypothetical protein
MDQFPEGRWRRRHKFIDISIEVIGSSINNLLNPPMFCSDTACCEFDENQTNKILDVWSK